MNANASERLVVSTWIHVDRPEDATYFPQIGATSDSRTVVDVYWRCVALFFATSVRNNPGAKHVLYTNVERAPTVDGVDLAERLAGWGVETVTLPFTFKPPKGFWGDFGNQFYLYDILRHAQGRYGRETAFTVFDSDCLWIRPGDALASATIEHRALTLDMGGRPERQINGVSLDEMAALLPEYGYPAHTGPLVYFGGESFSADGQAVGDIVDEVDRIFHRSVERFNAGAPKYNEEAHMLSVAYHVLGYRSGTANPFVRRIWTDKNRNVEPNDGGLTLWHLPAEKKTGLAALAKEALDPQSKFWTVPTGEPFAAYLGRFVGVPHRSRAKQASDFARKVAFRLAKR